MDYQEKIRKIISTTVESLNLGCEVSIKEEKEGERRNVFVSILTPENARFLIGKNGQNLKALEHVLKAVVLRDNQDINNIIVDVNDYKKSRASFVIDLAKTAVSRVRNTQKAETLQPMSSYERRIVHMELASYPDIATESIGDEPQRKVVIKPL